MSSASRNVTAINARAAAEFQRNLEGLFAEFDQMGKSVLSETVAIAFEETKQNTNTGTYDNLIYPDGSPDNYQKVGGTMKKAWQVSKIRKDGNALVGGYTNDTPYAIYVNNGHRQEVGRFVPAIGKRLIHAFVSGKHMLEIGMRKGEKALPLIFRDRLTRLKRKTGF